MRDGANLAATLARINPNEVHRHRRALWRCRSRAAAARTAGGDAADPRRVRRRHRRAAAVRLLRGRHHGRPSPRCRGWKRPRPPPAVTYIDRTQVGKRLPLSPPAREAAGTTMAIDPATRANLELTRTLAGERRGSLLDAIDCTVTAGRLAAAGATACRAADRRRDDRAPARCGRGFRHRRPRRATISAARCALRPTCRALARLSVGRGGPRDLAALRDGILAADQALARLARMRSDPPPEITARWRRCAGPSRDLAARVRTRRWPNELPLIKRDGGFMREGYEAALDETRNLRDALAPRGRRDAGALRRRHRHQGAEDPAQQRARLFRRGDGAARRQADGSRR